MRNPLRTEGEAFSFVLVIAGLGLAVGIAAWLGGTAAGVGVVIGVGVGVVAGIFLGRAPADREPPVWHRRPARMPRRILAVADETCTGRGLLDELRYRARGYEAEVLVVSPALATEAEERLQASLAELASAGVQARSEVGNADPLQAIEDALQTFRADEIVISTHPPGRSTWLERDVVAGARDRFDVPVTHVVVDLERERSSSGSP